MYGTLTRAASLSFLILSCANASAEGPDVMLGVLGAPIMTIVGDTAYLGAATTSCNAGNKPLAWDAKPSNKHPVIALNMYRLINGRMQQIGQSWLKHGTFALEHNACGFGCNATNQGNRLGPGCSDPYGAGMNMGPNLGSRGEVDPVTGEFDGATSNNHSGHTHPTGLEHSLHTARADLFDPGAELFIEGHYVTADDALAGNAHNNVSYRKVLLTTGFQGQPIFVEGGDTTWYKPAITAWPDATTKNVDSVEAKVDGKELTARIVVAAKVNKTPLGNYRYEYAVYNMNSARGVQAFAVPVGQAQISEVAMSAVRSHGEPWSNDLWDHRIENGRLVWSTKPYTANRNANAIRWGTTYNFWFETNTPPSEGDGTLTKFAPGEGPNILNVRIQAPPG